MDPNNQKSYVKHQNNKNASTTNEINTKTHNEKHILKPKKETQNIKTKKYDPKVYLNS